MAYLNAYIVKALCGGSSDWQVVDIDAPLEEMHETPIIYISLDSVPDLTAEEKRKLRAYTDTGGTILLEAVCGNPEVRKWAEKFVAEVWPEWRPQAPAAGPWRLHQPLADEAQRPELMGIDDGLTTRLLFAGRHLVRWQTRSVAAKEYLFQVRR